MHRRLNTFTRTLTALAVIAAAGLVFTGCGGGGGGPTAQANIGAIQIGPSTVFRVTVNSVNGLTGAATFNLINGAEQTARAPFGTQIENYVVNSTTITLAIYDAGGALLASTTLDAQNYDASFSGSVSLRSGTGQGVVEVLPLVPVEQSSDAVTPLQASQLNILARGIIPNVQRSGTFNNIVVPLYCGGSSSSFSPAAADGFFIINDVAIEFNYAFDNPTEFNDVLNIKFIESGRQFSNMQLYFKLPGAGRNVVNALTGQVVPTSALPAIYAGVATTVNSSTPFGTATATVNLNNVPFGPSMLVGTTVVSVQGNCVFGANSFYVAEPQETPDPDAIVSIGGTFDKPTQQQELILLILGDEVDSRDQTLSACDQWSVAQSGGFGTTIDTWNISQIPAGAVFDIRFNAFGIPDKFIVEYPAGNVVLDTGWRGDSSYNNNPLYPGGIAGPGSGQQDNIFTRGAVPSFKVTVIGPESGTAWNYSIRCRLN